MPRKNPRRGRKRRQVEYQIPVKKTCVMTLEDTPKLQFLSRNNRRTPSSDAKTGRLFFFVVWMVVLQPRLSATSGVGTGAGMPATPLPGTRWPKSSGRAPVPPQAKVGHWCRRGRRSRRRRGAPQPPERPGRCPPPPSSPSPGWIVVLPVVGSGWGAVAALVEAAEGAAAMAAFWTSSAALIS